MSRWDKISELLLEEIRERFDKEPLAAFNEVEFSENFAEMLDRFVVMHIRIWKIEDQIAAETNPEIITDLKRKEDILFKQKRPRLTKAINCFLDSYVSKVGFKPINDDVIKLYLGYSS